MGWASLTAASRQASYRLLGGVSVTAGAVSGMGLLDQKSDLVIDDQVISLEIVLTTSTELFGNLNYGDPIVVDGQSYVVRQEPMKIGDGSDCLIPLQKLEEGEEITVILNGDWL